MAKTAAAPIERMAGSKPHKGRQIALEIVTFLLFVLFMMPFIIVVFNSMRTNADIINEPVGIPTNIGQLWANITEIWDNPTFNFLTALRDSLIITVISLAVISVFSSMAAWVLVRNKTKWSNLIFMSYVAAMVIPFQVVMFPLLTWFKALGDFIHIPLLRSYQGIIFAYLSSRYRRLFTGGNLLPDRAAAPAAGICYRAGTERPVDLE